MTGIAGNDEGYSGHIEAAIQSIIAEIIDWCSVGYHQRWEGHDDRRFGAAACPQIRDLSRGLHAERADHPRPHHVPPLRMGGRQSRPPGDPARGAAGELDHLHHRAVGVGHRHQHDGRGRRRVLHDLAQPRARARRRHRHPALPLPDPEHHLLQLRSGGGDPRDMALRWGEVPAAAPQVDGGGHHHPHHAGLRQERGPRPQAADPDHGRGRRLARRPGDRQRWRRAPGRPSSASPCAPPRRASGTSSPSSSRR